MYIIGTRVTVTGTRHNGATGTVVGHLNRLHIVRIDNTFTLNDPAFYYFQLIPDWEP